MRSWGFVIIFFLLSGCRGTVTDEGKPLPIQTASTSAAQFTAIATQWTAWPTPSEKTGVVVGRFISTTTKGPLVSQIVYLGDFLPLSPGSNYLITLEVERSPHTKTNHNGEFFLVDISPGSYPLIIWTPFRSLVVPDSSGEKEFRVNVMAGEITELGVLDVEWP